MTKFSRLVLLCCSLFSSELFASRAFAQESVRLGAILPMSGSSAFIGASARIGIRAALYKINNEEGGILGNKLEVVFEDSRSDPEVAVASYKRLVEKYDPAAVISALSNVSLSLKPVANAEGRLLFAQSSNPKLIEKGGSVFRTFYTTDQPNTALLTALKAKFLNVAAMEGKVLQVAVLHAEEEWGQNGFANFLEQLKSTNSIRLIAHGAFSKDEQDFKGQLTKLKKLKPDVLYILGSGSAAARAYEQIKAIGVAPEVYGLGLCNAGSVSKSAKDSLEGVFSIDPQLDLSKDLFRKLEKIYREERPDTPVDMTSIATFDTILILSEALRAGAKTSDAMKKFIIKKKDFQGIAGKVSFDANGDAKWKAVVQKISNGKCAPLP